MKLESTARSNAATLKGIKTERARTQRELDEILIKIADISKELDGLNSLAASLSIRIEDKDRELEDFKTQASKSHGAPEAQLIVVSEHAILRYVELAMGLDTEQITSKILTPNVERIIHGSKGKCKLPLEGDENLIAVVKGHTIVTIHD